MPSYRQADRPVYDLTNRLLQEHHRELAESGVTVACLTAHASVHAATGEPKGAAISQEGRPLLATIKINPLRDRVQRKMDATLTLDGDAFPLLTPQIQAAVIDGQLTRLELARDKDGNIETDDASRPKLNKRPFDFFLAGYLSTVDRYGNDSVELIALEEIRAKLSLSTTAAEG